jgi:hypothetical protein
MEKSDRGLMSDTIPVFTGGYEANHAKLPVTKVICHCRIAPLALLMEEKALKRVR